MYDTEVLRVEFSILHNFNINSYMFSLSNLSMCCRTKSIDNSYAYNGMLWHLFF